MEGGQGLEFDGIVEVGEELLEGDGCRGLVPVYREDVDKCAVDREEMHPD